MLALEDYSIFNSSRNDEDDGAEADMNNLDTTIQKEPKKVIHALKDPSWIEAMHEELLQFKLQEVWTLVDVPYGKRANKAIRLSLAYASFKDFVVYQIDVKSIFLYGKIKEEVKVLFSMGRLQKKCMYVNHQDLKIQTFLIEYTRYKGDILLVQVYVDDIIFGSTKKELCNAFEKLMHEKFQMSSMGELSFFLGLQVQQKKDGILIRLNGEEVDVHMYRSMIGSLMYLTSSRPDIMFAVCACARYQVNPKVSHLHAVKSIFRYLRGQSKLGIWYPKDSPFDLVAYTNSDYAEASLDRKSTIGGGGPRRQETMGNTTARTRVLDLETTKTTQANEIASLKRRVKKLEKKKRLRTPGLKRLYKVGLRARVESSGDEEDLGEDASKQGRINAIDANEDITLVNDQDDADMFDVNTLAGEEVFVAEQSGNVLRKYNWQTKRAEEKRNKPPTQAQQRKIMCTYLKNMEGKKPKDLKNKSFDYIQKMFDKAFKRVNTFVDYRTQLVEENSKKAKTELEENLKKTEAEVMEGSSKRAGEKLEQESIKKQKLDEDRETAELQSLIKVIPDEE
ncbi:putative ribonuclease H-like domain-containing protein [Tanacetum coccineum]